MGLRERSPRTLVTEGVFEVLDVTPLIASALKRNKLTTVVIIIINKKRKEVIIRLIITKSLIIACDAMRVASTHSYKICLINQTFFRFLG